MESAGSIFDSGKREILVADGIFTTFGTAVPYQAGNPA